MGHTDVDLRIGVKGIRWIPMIRCKRPLGIKSATADTILI